jgi:hypothetical protein
MSKKIAAVFLLLIILYMCSNFSNQSIESYSKKVKTINACGSEGHFSHSDGGGKFSWNAIHLNNHKGMSNPYLFIMFETYKDGTSDHYIVDIIDLPTMTANFITADGKLSILRNNNLTVSAPDQASLLIIAAAQKSFFSMLPCYSGSYSGRGIQ